MRKLLTIVAIGVAVLVSACGGGGGSSTSGGGSSSSSSSSSSAPPDYSSNAAAAKISVDVTMNPSISNEKVTLAWTDTFPAGTIYTIKSADGALGSGAAVTGTGGAMTWVSPAFLTTDTTYQIQATVGSTLYTLQTAEGATSVTAQYFRWNQLTVGAVSDETSTYSSDHIKGNTTFKINGSSTAFSAVNWLVDGISIGTGASAVNNSVSWNSATTSYDHYVTVTADILAAPSSHILLTRSFTTHNTSLLFGTYSDVSDSSAHIYVESPQAAESYQDGIPVLDVKMGVVSLAIDGTTVASLTGPNQCSQRNDSHSECELAVLPPGPSYGFAYNANPTQNAQHTAVFTATDQAGNTGQFQETFFEPYKISTVITSPTNNAVVSGTVHYAGTTTDLEPGGPVSTAIWLNGCGGTLIAQPTGTSFSGDIDLAPGTYVLCAIGYMQDHTASSNSVVFTVK